MIKAIMIEKPYRAIALTDGWLCIKYLEGGEESLTTFADISKGDVITYGRSRLYNPQAEREQQCETCKHKGTRACSSHGYDDVPISCSYKLGIYAEEAMKNLNGTFIDVWTPEHDKQVRERVLDELVEWRKNQFYMPKSCHRIWSEENLFLDLLREKI